MSNDQKWLIGAIVGALLFCMCIGMACVMLGGFTIMRFSNAPRQVEPEPFPGPARTVEVIPMEPERTPDPGAETLPTLPPMPLDEDAGPAGEEAYQTLQMLEEVIVPINDPRDLARRLEGKEDIPETVPAPDAPLQVGDRQEFWVSNVDTNENFRITATLEYVTDHLYFWIEQGVAFDAQALQDLADTFENEIYPTNREFFGSEWSPGIDNDEHLYVLFAGGLGTNIAGYFSSADAVHPEAHRYSNAHEMFLMNADVLDLSDPYIYGTMAHEFQHMIHWYRDRNEESWLNEGFSVLAEFLNGFQVGGFDFLYVMNPDIQLTHWPSPPNSTPHYGASFLFLAYFLDRFGDEATQAVVGHADNGMDSIDEVLAMLGEVDVETGEPLTADDVFADWVVATYLNDPDVEEGQYAYTRYEEAPRPGPTEEIDDCEADWETRTVRQYGVDYIEISCSGSYTLQFEGNAEVGVLPEDAHSGSYAFWSNKGDQSDMTLTQTFDFTSISGPLTLQYYTWYDLEEDYDYLYLLASVDGENWQILETPSGRPGEEDPSGNAYGWAYNGQSGGWIEESVDISQFAGQEVMLRFEYITDAAVNGEGLLLDDVRIPEIGYSTDFETDDGGWISEGFVRIQNRLPQFFRVSLIEDGREINVQQFTVDSGQRLEIPLKFDGEMDSAVLVVSGVTRFTTQEATYRFRFQP